MASVEVSLAQATAPTGEPLSVFSKFAQFFANLAIINRRATEFEALACLSDEELAKRGLKREDIARFILRDIYYI